MKNYLFAFILILSAGIFFSCGNDDDTNNPCNQSNWVGTYSGTCENIDYNLIITASGDNSIEAELEGGSGTDTALLLLDGCNASFNLIGISIEATLNGNSITYNTSLSDCDGVIFTRN